MGLKHWVCVLVIAALLAAGGCVWWEGEEHEGHHEGGWWGGERHEGERWGGEQHEGRQEEGRDGRGEHRDPPADTQTAAPAQPEKAKSASERLAEEKDALVNSARADLDKIEKGMKDLSAKADEKGAEIKADFQTLKADVQKKVAATRQQLTKVKESTSQDWDKVKAGVQDALADARETYQKAAARVEGKPQPGSEGAPAAGTSKSVSERLTEEKDALAKTAEVDLKSLENDMDELGRKANAKGAQVKADFETLKADVAKKMDSAKAELSKAEKASADTWDKAKAGVQKALADVKETYQKAAARVEGKPEPSQAGATTGQPGPGRNTQ